MLRFVALFLLVMLFPLSACALDIVVDDSYRETELQQGIRYWLTDDTLATPPAPDSPLWQTSEDTLTFGFEPRTLWLTFTITNESSHAQHLVLDVGYPLLDEVDIHYQLPGRETLSYELGDTRPAENASILHPHIIAVLNLPENQQARVLMRIRTSATLNVPMRLWQVETFIEQSQLDIAWYVMVYGMLVGIALYHLLIYLQLREPGFLWFSIFLFSLVGVFAFFQGILTTYVFPGLRETSNNLLIWLYVIAASSCSLYVLRTLDVKRYRRRYAYSLYGLIALGGILLLLSLLVSYSVIIRLLTVYALISMVVVVNVQIRRSLDRYQPAYYAIAASLFCVVGMIIIVLEKTGAITSTALTRSAGDVGLTLMAMLYAMMLSYRMRWEQIQRKKAQQESYELQVDLLKTQTQLNKELEQLVSKRTEELEKANDQLRTMSITDALTGLYNRRYFDQYFHQQYLEQARNGEPLGILLADIDHFKNINDTYGHPFGDACLIQFAARIEQIIRNKGYTAARYGGEEFIIVLPGADAEETVRLGNALLTALRFRDVSIGDKTVAMTASVGAVSAVPKKGADPDELLKAADEFLYEAKHQGRNRVVGHPVPPVEVSE